MNTNDTKKEEGKSISGVVTHFMVSNWTTGIVGGGDAFKFYPWKDASVLQGKYAESGGRRLSQTEEKRDLFI